MASFTLNSKIHGEQRFTCQNTGGYVRLNGKQICEGGYLSGSTVSITSSKTDFWVTDEQLARVARRWWKSYLRNTKEFR